MMKRRAAITGVHGYVPEHILTNADLEKMVDTNNEWIITRTGIEERRILKGEGLGTSFMSIKAVEGLLEKTNTDPKEIDMLICATVTPDMVFPATANIITAKLGATRAFGYDVEAACSGFLYSLVTASQFIETGKYKKIIVVGADKMSSIINYEDRSTCVIFGDGAGAVLLEPNEDDLGLMDSCLYSDGAGAEFLYMKAGGSCYPSTEATVAAKEHYVSQQGSAVFKSAVKRMSEVATEVMEKNKLTADDVAYLVPHQANKRIIEATARSLGLSNEKVLINITKYGNTTGGTIPLCLWDFENQFKKGDTIIMAAFGGGFTWGSAYLKWAY